MAKLASGELSSQDQNGFVFVSKTGHKDAPEALRMPVPLPYQAVSSVELEALMDGTILPPTCYTPPADIVGKIEPTIEDAESHEESDSIRLEDWRVVRAATSLRRRAPARLAA